MGPVCDGIDDEGKTIMHHAAISGSEAALRLLEPHKHLLPPATTDSAGRAPIDYASARSPGDLPASLIESLFDLVGPRIVDVEEEMTAGAGISDSGSDYEDAVEELLIV
jgi:ankyrin repeat protein